jgi:hypothetical protein
VPVATAHVYYPEVSNQRCTVTHCCSKSTRAAFGARGRGSCPDAFALGQYVNDRAPLSEAAPFIYPRGTARDPSFRAASQHLNNVARAAHMDLIET